MMVNCDTNFFSNLLSCIDEAIKTAEDINRTTANSKVGNTYGTDECEKCNGCYGFDGDATGTECEGCGGCDGYEDGCEDDYDESYIPRIPNIIDHIIFNKPATIVFWVDGTKTVVKCTESDTYSKEVGVALAVLKKLYGSSYYRQISQAIANFSVDNSNIKPAKSAEAEAITAETVVKIIKNDTATDDIEKSDTASTSVPIESSVKFKTVTNTKSKPKSKSKSKSTSKKSTTNKAKSTETVK